MKHESSPKNALHGAVFLRRGTYNKKEPSLSIELKHKAVQSHNK